MPYRLLLIDDDRRFREALAAFLESHGFDVIAVAENGREGVERADSAAVDVVLMDVDMPVLDGIEASRRIHERRPELPIVLVSASEFEDRVANARDVGAVGYVRKGRVTEDLVLTILSIVNQDATDRRVVEPLTS